MAENSNPIGRRWNWDIALTIMGAIGLLCGFVLWCSQMSFLLGQQVTEIHTLTDTVKEYALRSESENGKIWARIEGLERTLNEDNVRLIRLEGIRVEKK